MTRKLFDSTVLRQPTFTGFVRDVTSQKPVEEARARKASSCSTSTAGRKTRPA
jgi:hypothetical protein